MNITYTMSKKIKMNSKIFSTCGIVLLSVSLALLLVVVWNKLTGHMSTGVVNLEGFEQIDKVTIKEGPLVYDDFYVNIYDELVFNQQKNEYEIGEIMKITKQILSEMIKTELSNLKEENSVESETHRNRVVQASGVLRSKMESLVDEAFFLADELDMGREETRAVFKQAAEELQNMQSPSDNPVTKLVIEKLKFLVQPGVLIDEIGDAIIAFDE